MKLYKYITIVCLLIVTSACNDDELIEKPLDFLSPEVAYVKPADFEAALVANYNLLRTMNDGNQNKWQHSGTDLCMAARSPETADLGDYRTGLTPTTETVKTWWQRYYQMIANSNVILNRIKDVVYTSQSEKDRHIAEARWFRGYAYRCLVYIYGGVPIVLEEIQSPRRDFVRATKTETLNQAILDIKFASVTLPSVTEVLNGKLSKEAALHLLAELYISTGELDKSIAASSEIIDNPAIKLMTTRFGKRASNVGDPYWDLFQRGNQDRGSGINNTEGILVLQEEFNIPGGSPITNGGAGGFLFERNYGCLYWFLNGPDGKPLFRGATSKNGGRPVGFIRPTPYFTHKIWGWNSTTKTFGQDLRNDNRNIQRDWEIDGPNSAYLGKKISELPQSWFTNLKAQDTMRDFYPNVTKISTYNDHPAEVLQPDGTMSSTSGKTYADQYIMRLAETYLLRAEAYLGKGNTSAAADDINMLRNRANAIPVLPGQVNINYILDERMRELNYEEQRRITLSRLNLLYDRTVLGNPFSALTIKPYNTLFPIPFSEIERNTLAVLEQNPGYTN